MPGRGDGVGTQRLSLVEVTGNEPLALAVLRDHVRASSDDDDGELSDIAMQAREMFEAETGRQLIEATYSLTLDRFPGSRHTPIELPRPPLQSVTSIVYEGTDGATTTWDTDEYTVQTFDGPFARYGRVFPGADYTWPDTRSVPGAVVITYSAGYSILPYGVEAVVKALAADLYAIRETQVTGTVVNANRTVERLLKRYRIPAVA
ncbi:MAG: head-tail connector protein [Gemmatimonadota bacterium]